MVHPSASRQEGAELLESPSPGHLQPKTAAQGTVSPNGPAVAQCKVGMAAPFPSAQALLQLLPAKGGGGR